MRKKIYPPSGQHIILHTVSQLAKRSREPGPKKPFVLGISGPQGSGKSTIASFVAEGLRAKNISVAEFSIDDVYYGYERLLQVKATGNLLLARRGLPGTHDVDLCVRVFNDLLESKPVDLPVYDKSAFGGQGDRSSRTRSVVPPYQVIVFEGWCVGFPHLSESEVVKLWTESQGTLAKFKLEDVLYVNKLLIDYERIWDKFDSLVQLDAQDLAFVYDWRLQQEHQLIHERGSGMTDLQVREFVDGYMPAYELYLEHLRKRADLRIVLSKSRKVVSKQIAASL
jgi:D-glycerate 3-kinase